MPEAWHYISGQFSIPAPRKPQKSAIFLPQPPPKLFNLSLNTDVTIEITDKYLPFFLRGCDLTVNTVSLALRIQGKPGNFKVKLDSYFVTGFGNNNKFANLPARHLNHCPRPFWGRM